jgi:sarcosine oxidase subunit beta
MAKKIVLCRCEDVTLSDLEHCVDRGYLDIEEVKRYTGFGTGPCQGKECLGPMATQLARLTRRPPAEIPAFTSRPPIAPTPIKLLANAPDAHRFDDDLEPKRAGTVPGVGVAK